MHGSLRRRVSHPKPLADPDKARQLVLRETAFIHKEYKNCVQLIHDLIQAESDDHCARSTSASRQASRTHPTLPPQSDRRNWGLKPPRKRTCEHPRRLDSTACILTDQGSKFVSRPCGASPQFTSIPLISANIQKSHCKTSQIGRIR